MDHDATDSDYAPVMRIRLETVWSGESRLYGGDHFPYSLPEIDPVSKKPNTGICKYPGCKDKLATDC